VAKRSSVEQVSPYSESPAYDDEKRNAAGYLALEEAFVTEQAKIEAIRAQGITVPE